MKTKVLIADSDLSLCRELTTVLASSEFVPLEAHSVGAGLAVLDREQPETVLASLSLPSSGGLDVLRSAKGRDPRTAAILVADQPLTPEEMSEAFRLRINDFLLRPVRMDQILSALIHAGTNRSHRREERQRRECGRGFEQIVTQSPVMLHAMKIGRRVADSQASTILLQGESGTGKDLFARCIHAASPRADKPFVAVNCSAIPSTLIESELFGYEAGAFTDAKKTKIGLFEQASGGTLFLDEIGEIDLGLQAKLLRVIEEGKIRRVGGIREMSFDVRVIAATNRDLLTEVRAKKFRLDLYFRLCIIQIDIPPLRERREDITAIADNFIRAYNRKLYKKVQGLSPETEDIFLRYDWPGNVRELRNAIERAMILEEGDWISPAYLPKSLQERHHVPGSTRPSCDETLPNGRIILPPTGISLKEVETSLVRQALHLSHGNQAKAARLLRITRDQLHYRLRKLEEEEAP